MAVEESVNFQTTTTTIIKNIVIEIVFHNKMSIFLHHIDIYIYISLNTKTQQSKTHNNNNNNNYPNIQQNKQNLNIQSIF
jgi:hypothetical protein